VKAIVLGNSGSGRPSPVLVDRPAPVAARGEVVVQMKACGLCGTDLEKMKGEYTAAMPVLGHEAVGVVSEVGQDVAGFQKGDRVFPHHHVSCGKCRYCTRGSETMCASYRASNLDPGGFSEFFRVPSENVSKGGVLRLPSGVTDEEGALIEPLACCLRAAKRAGLREEDRVLVVGAGPVGLMSAMVAKHIGASPVVSDISKTRLELAEGLDVAPVLDASTGDVASEVRKMTGGDGADVAVVAAGSKEAIVQALRSVRRGGSVCLLGIPAKGAVLDYDFSDIFNMEVSLVSSYGATEADTALALELIANGKLSTRSLVTHRFALERFSDAVKAASSGEAMKIVVVPKNT
jgi:L-iditol 2-dehydrogenase